MAASHPDFSKLAARLAIDNLHKNTSDDFVCVMRQLNSYVGKGKVRLSAVSRWFLPILTRTRVNTKVETCSVTCYPGAAVIALTGVALRKAAVFC